MKIQSVRNFTAVSYPKTAQKFEKSSAQAPNFSIDSNSVNFLTDLNYNNAFINFRNISFKGKDLPKVSGINPIESEVNLALGFAGNNDLVIIGRDVETAREDMLKSIETFPKAINSVFFVPDEKAKSTIAMASNINGVPYVQNLGNTPIYQISGGSVNKICKNEYMFPRDDNEFRNGRIGLPFSVKPDFDGTVDDLARSKIQIFDFSSIESRQIAELNKQRITTMGAQKQDVEEPIKKLTFADVGGQDKAIKELKEAVVYPLKYPQAFRVINHGVILEGGPGTGKTLIAQALANEVDANFIKLNGLEMESKWVGASEENMRNLFEEAKAKQPCIVFIDEFDAIARKREGSETSRHDDKMVNQMLSLMSDLEKDGDQVFVIAATNKKDIIDEAILRSGRFGKQINVPNPDLDGCKKIFKIHTSKKQIPDEDGFESEKYAKKFYDADFSGAEIAETVSEAQGKTYSRNNIYEKMENGTFNMSDIENLRVGAQDYDDAFDTVNAKKTPEEKKKFPIGFEYP